MIVQFIRKPIFLCVALILSAIVTSAQAEEPPLATEDEVVEVYGILQQWIEAYREKDYTKQWRLTDSRIRRWHNRKRWRGWMREAQKNNGDLLSYMAVSGAPVTADQIPCTEQGHCFRPEVQYIIFLIRTEYEKAEPGQPEFAVMAKSSEGWKFGGGTILNRPMGETSAIMTVQDEARYRPRYFSQ